MQLHNFLSVQCNWKCSWTVGQQLGRFPTEPTGAPAAAEIPGGASGEWSTRTEQSLLVAGMTEFPDVAVFLQQSFKNSLHVALLSSIFILFLFSYLFFSVLYFTIQQQIFWIRFRFHFFPFLAYKLTTGTEALAQHKQN